MMFARAKVVVASTALVGACLASSAHAAFFSFPLMLKAHLERIVFDVPALPPLAHARFCLQYPADCQVRRSFRLQPIALTPELGAELVSVNRKVNQAIVPQRNFGGVVAERWLISPRAGDCNDYAVTKRHQLLVRGWPSRALILSEVVVASGEHHLVLVVRTKEGDLVLDNLNYDVRPVAMTRYRWVRAQSPDNPKFWSTINLAASAPDATPARSRLQLSYLRTRAALALHKGETEDCCRTDRDRAAEYAVVAERQEQQQ